MRQNLRPTVVVEAGELASAEVEAGVDEAAIAAAAVAMATGTTVVSAEETATDLRLRRTQLNNG